jgi:hypothetical protein
MPNWSLPRDGSPPGRRLKLQYPEVLKPFLVPGASRFECRTRFTRTHGFEYWLGFDPDRGRDVLVRKAVKLRPSSRVLRAHATTLTVLGTLRNPFVLELYAFANNPISTITEPCAHVLDDVLAPGCAVALDGTALTGVALGVASGMQALHRSGFILKRLDARGIFLVDGSLRAKIGIFDEAHRADESPGICGRPPSAFDSPELLSNSPYDWKTDVYSFAMLLYVLATRKPPFGMLDPQAIVAKVQAGERPSIPLRVPSGITGLIRKCWDQDPARRPT